MHKQVIMSKEPPPLLPRKHTFDENIYATPKVATTPPPRPPKPIALLQPKEIDETWYSAIAEPIFADPKTVLAEVHHPTDDM